MILQEQKEYYTLLYSLKTDSENTVKDSLEFLSQEFVPRLCEEQSRLCEGLVNPAEAADALCSMKTGSAPGVDGISIDFMKVFWSKISRLLVDSFNESFEREELSYTQNQGVIILLHKGKDLDRERLSNWRPITLKAY